jgi:hypothetical protein
MENYAVRFKNRNGRRINLQVFPSLAGAERPYEDEKFIFDAIVEALPRMNRKKEVQPPLAQAILASKASRSEDARDTIDRFLEREIAFIQLVKTVGELENEDFDYDLAWANYYDKEVEDFLHSEPDAPWVEFEVEVSRADWLEHLEEGRVIESTAYFD